ncbi:Transcription initiation factor TFIID, subunit TAF12 (also component of histone acetyltransferase SAGA) [Mycobacteroides abscessus subsp. bolletii]|uniref:hypothetical protein n=1 Tax=Mycobacteroides abscessus TaxID=36809 RepID=UPI0009A6F3B2|nr:hypothetical protein [Mycobacteroides abscessus]SLI07867.1 Transcription initiation factor TFIID, subunit TAF12 (also component of histone acetyltransferase SAGA) [Mycobacteroides abscessus subsp. bolletii]
MVMKDRWGISPGLRKILAVTALVTLAIGGAKVVSDYTAPGSGFSTVQTAAADPTGPPVPGGMDGPPGGGSGFQPPSMPAQQPEYQGGNQPPLNQDNGISIYQTGAQGAPQQGGPSGAQQAPQQAQQPAHGTQIPDYQTATPFTQGPGKPNPDYQAPQQQQPQQGQQPQQQQPSQAPTQTQQPQNKQDDTTQQLDQKKQQCQLAAVQLATAAATTAAPVIRGGGGRSPIWWIEPGLDPTPAPTPPCPQGTDCTQKAPPLTPEQIQQILNDPAVKNYIDTQIKKGVQEGIKAEKDKPPILDSLFGGIVGCASGALGGAALGALEGGIGAGPGAILGCLGGLIGGTATPMMTYGLQQAVPTPAQMVGQ